MMVFLSSCIDTFFGHIQRYDIEFVENEPTPV